LATPHLHPAKLHPNAAIALGTPHSRPNAATALGTPWGLVDTKAEGAARRHVRKRL